MMVLPLVRGINTHRTCKFLDDPFEPHLDISFRQNTGILGHECPDKTPCGLVLEVVGPVCLETLGRPILEGKPRLIATMRFSQFHPALAVVAVGVLLDDSMVGHHT